LQSIADSYNRLQHARGKTVTRQIGIGVIGLGWMGACAQLVLPARAPSTSLNSA